MTQDIAVSPKRANDKTVKMERSSSSSIAQLVRQEEMNVTQMEMSDEEHSQICQDSPTNDGWDDGNDSDDRSQDYRKNIVEEVCDNEGDYHLEAGNPYASSNEKNEKGEIVPDKNLPCDRWGHTMTLIDEDRLLVYGGQTFDMKENKIMTLADLHVYDLSKNVWSRPVNCEGMPRCWVS
jgi:hypothetical protein